MELVRMIRVERKKRNMTQQDLADALGVCEESISLYESGKTLPSLSVLMKLAVIFDYDLSASVNYKILCGKIDSCKIKNKLARYGLSYSEIGRELGYDESLVRKTVNLEKDASLECLSQILAILENEQSAYKFRCKLLRKGR